IPIDAGALPTLRLYTGLDNEGRPWAYIYTTSAAFAKAFPRGGKYAEMSFVDVFELVEKDEQFGGIFINANSDKYPIPREMMPHVRSVLDEDGSCADGVD